MEDFKNKLIESFKSGLLLLVKYGLLVLLILYGFNYSINTRDMAINGQQAAIAIKMFQEKGYLPQFNSNGTISDKSKIEDKSIIK